MTATITDFPSMKNIDNPNFRRMMRRAILENRRMPQVNLPSETISQVLAFRKSTRMMDTVKEDAVDG